MWKWKVMGGQGFLAADLDGEGRAMGYFYGYVGLGREAAYPSTWMVRGI